MWVGSTDFAARFKSIIKTHSERLAVKMEQNKKGKKLEQCALCGKHLKNETNLLNHVIQVHGESEQEINNCALCDKDFTSSRNLLMHVSQVHGEERLHKGCY